MLGREEVFVEYQKIGILAGLDGTLLGVCANVADKKVGKGLDICRRCRRYCNLSHGSICFTGCTQTGFR